MLIKFTFIPYNLHIVAQRFINKSATLCETLKHTGRTSACTHKEENNE